LVINPLAFAPIACANDSDAARLIGKANRQNSSAVPIRTKAIISKLFLAMGLIFRNDALRIQESMLSLIERNPRLALIQGVLRFIPFEA
jgi:hypothetical protein